MPTAFSAGIKLEQKLQGTENRFTIKLVHLRDDIFLVGYASNELIVKDLATGEELDRIQLDFEQPLMDFDVYQGDLTKILVGFRGDVIFKVNMATKQANPFEHYHPHPLTQLMYLQHMPGEHFLTLSKGGTYRLWDKGLRTTEIGRFHPMQYLADMHRPFSLCIELENDE